MNSIAASAKLTMILTASRLNNEVGIFICFQEKFGKLPREGALNLFQAVITEFLD